MKYKERKHYTRIPDMALQEILTDRGVKDIENFMDPEKPDNNIILTQTESIMLNGRPKKPEYAVNKNVLVIGGSGSGKTRYFVKPNLMQCHSSYVVSDPKGTVLNECGNMLVKNGYKISCINTIDFSKSMHYNPFAYIRSEKDIIKLVTIFMANTKGENQASGDQFWDNAERLLYMAYIGYIYYECIEEEQNFETLLFMINVSETREDDEDFKNAIDLIFEDLEKVEPDHFAVLQYKKLKLSAGVAECRWYLVSVFYKIQATTYILHIGIDKCRKELL